MPTQFTSAYQPVSFWQRIWRRLFPGRSPEPIELGPVYANVDANDQRLVFTKLLGDAARFAIFRNGTCVVMQSAEQLPDAIQKLHHHGRLEVGTPSGDFSVTERTDLNGVVVTFDHPDILVFVPKDFPRLADRKMNEVLQGLHARACRDTDARYGEVVATNEGLIS